MNIPPKNERRYIRKHPPIRGTAQIVELGFDLDEVKRYAVYKLTPPLEDGTEYHKQYYISMSLEPDGSLLRAPVLEKHELGHLRNYCRFLGYQLVDEDGNPVEADS